MSRDADSSPSRVRCAPVACVGVPVLVQLARFRGDSGVEELHLTARPTAPADFARQLVWLARGVDEVLGGLGVPRDSAVLRRFFCRDPASRAAAREHRTPFSVATAANDRDGTNRDASCNVSCEASCATSWVGQAPPPPAEVALWSYHVHDPAGLRGRHYNSEDRTLAVPRGELTHYWTCGASHGGPAGAGEQTTSCLAHYAGLLERRGLRLADHVVRTWLFLRDVDADYAAMVAARRDFFAAHGLTADTHYVASTGIGAAGAAPTERVTLDAHAIAGLRPAQVEYLRLPGQMSPTSMYGVTFERGTAITYRDRRHVLLSGTASIDDHGRTLHVGDLTGQLERTFANLQALLDAGGATRADVCQLLAYVRNPADAAAVEHAAHAHFGGVPLLVVHGAVCRPEWLVEIEGQALVPAARPDLPAF